MRQCVRADFRVLRNGDTTIAEVRLEVATHCRRERFFTRIYEAGLYEFMGGGLPLVFFSQMLRNSPTPRSNVLDLITYWEQIGTTMG